MKNSKTLNVVTNVLYIASGLTFASSFFVKDNEKAVNRRWLSVGLFAGAWGIELTSKIANNKKLIGS